jgi:TonB family protein
MNTGKKLITLLTVMLACISLNAQVTTFDDTYTCPPQFPGGDAELIQFLNENIQYPAQAARDKIEGKVVVQFMVKKTGKIDKVKVLRSVRKDLDKEAVRVIKMMPDFTPGKQNGETVDMQYTVPVTFKLFDEMEPLTVSEGSDVPDDFQPPMFPGGDRALMEFLKENVKYPPMAAKRKTQGRVVMTFVVDKTGKVSEIKVAKSVDIYLDTEAIRVCKLLPDFIPAKQNGEPVSVWFTLPITFKL